MFKGDLEDMIAGLLGYREVTQARREPNRRDEEIRREIKRGRHNETGSVG